MPEVTRLANTQLHQACYAVLHHLASPSSLTERRTGLHLPRLLEQRFVWMHQDRPSALTPRAAEPQWTRRTCLGGEDERPTSIFSRSKITRLLLVRAGARASLQIDPEVGLGKVALILNL